MSTLKLTNVQLLRRAFRADIEIDGRYVGYVERYQQSSTYRAYVDGRVISSRATLRELRADLRAHFTAAA